MKSIGITSVIVKPLIFSLYGTKTKNIPNRMGLKKIIFENLILTGFSISANI